MAGMKMVVRLWLRAERPKVEAWWQKFVLHKIIFVLRSDNSSVNAVPLAADRSRRLQHDVQSNS
jgi:hypothetical protein